MKVVVNNVIYDTDDAEVCGTSVPQTITLYRRLDDGTYFLLKESHQTFRSLADCGTGIKVRETTETIISPMSDADAQTWAEHNLPVETVYSLFLNE